jgi:hypothetical protein
LWVALKKGRHKACPYTSPGFLISRARTDRLFLGNAIGAYRLLSSMTARHSDDLDHALDRFEQRLPAGIARFVRWARKPSSLFLRVPLALLLIAGGIVGFLPILGFWMVPLGLVLIAQDVPFLRPPLARFLAWIERKWPAKETNGRKSRNSA